jgi:hypothetical protein
MRQQASVSVCASEKGKPVVGGDAKPRGTLPSWELAGLSNSSGEAAMPRRQKGGCGCDLTSTTAIRGSSFTHLRSCFVARRARGVDDERGVLRHSYLRHRDRQLLLRQTARWASPRRCSRISSSPSGGLWSECNSSGAYAAPYERAKVQQTPPTRCDLRGLLDAFTCVGNNARALYRYRVFSPRPDLGASVRG